MNEWILVWLVPLRIFIVLVFATIYCVGGRRWKWIRRWVGGSFMAASLIGLSIALGRFSWPFAAASVGIYGGLVLGYGAKTTARKVLRRALYGLALGLSGFGIGLTQGVWLLGLFQVILAVFASVYLGVLNPAKSAVDEEALIALLGTAVLPFMI